MFGISLKVGSGRIGGTAESLVQQPQDVKKIASAPTEMVRRNRVIRLRLIEYFFIWKKFVIKRIKRKPRPFPGKRAGREPDLLSRSLVSRCCRSTWAARSCEEGCDSGNDGKFDDVHIGCVVCWLLDYTYPCWIDVS